MKRKREHAGPKVCGKKYRKKQEEKKKKEIKDEKGKVHLKLLLIRYV